MDSPVRYTWRCENGHEQGVFASSEEANHAAGELRRCDRCNGVASVASFEVRSTATATGLLEPHFNYSFGQEVKGPRHMRELQKKHGTQDYIPVKDSPVSELRKKYARLIR